MLNETTTISELTATIIARFADAARSAAAKESVSELTQEEACAICLFAGVPYTVDVHTGKIKFAPCGLYKKNRTWTAVVYCQQT